MTGYDSDLAYIQEAAFGGFARAASPGLLALLHESGLDSGLVVDLGCGAGVWATELIAAGYDVLVIDTSRSLIDYARRRAPGARFEVASLFRAELPECVAVTALGEALSYRFDTSGKPVELFGRVQRALVPGGIFVFDLPETGSGWNAARHVEGKDWALVVDVVHDPRRRRLKRSITTFRKIGRYYRRGHETHEVNLFVAKEVLNDLAAAGFEATTTRRDGNFDLPPRRIALVAKKRV